MAGDVMSPMEILLLLFNYMVMLTNWFINTQIHTYLSAAPSLQRRSEQRSEVNVDTLT